MGKKIDLSKKVTVNEVVRRTTHTRRINTSTHIITNPIFYEGIEYNELDETTSYEDEYEEEDFENDDYDDELDDNMQDDESTDDIQDELQNQEKKKKKKNDNSEPNSQNQNPNTNNNVGDNSPAGKNSSTTGTPPSPTPGAGTPSPAPSATSAGGASAGSAAAGGAAAGGAAAGGAAAGGAAAGGAAAGGAAAGGAAAAPILGYIAIAILIIIAVILLIVIIVAIVNNYNSSSISFGGMYNGRCNEMTVIFVDSKNGYTPTGTQTYSMTDYVAGVVYAEVGGARNIEVYKTFAIAARTFGLKHASEDCTIEGSARRQAFKDVTAIDNEYVKMIYEAVEATEGQVLLSNDDLYSIQYDAFCYIDKDSNYYTLSQKNQKIPVDWVESNIGSNEYTTCPCDLKDESMTECWDGKTWKDGGHGRGMSQYGSYYLARELDYTYDQILNYYYGNDEITISSNSFTGGIEGITSIAGLEIKDTTKANYLKQPITEFLNSKGSSLDNLNAFIHDSVVDQGAGTRAGVVTAAVSMINYLYDNFNVRLPYYWGGSSERIGLPSSFGTYSPSSVSRGGNVNYYKSFDCSGFVSWVIKNGGYNFSRISTTGFDSKFSQNSCNIADSNCVGQPGDLINSRNGHVELIIAVDQEKGKYFIAHSGGPGVVMMERDMHTKNYGSTITKILFMEEFYSNPLNVNPNY